MAEEEFFPQTKRLGKPNTIVNGQFIADGNFVHPTAENVIVTGVDNTVGPNARDISIFNSSGCVVAPNVRGGTLVNCSGTILSENNLTIINDTIISRGKKRTYKANLFQAGTSNPVATVLENSFDGPIVWTRVSDGNYIGTLAGAFEGDYNKMYLTIAPYGESEYIIISSIDSVQILTKVAGVATDDCLVQNSIEITRYGT